MSFSFLLLIIALAVIGVGVWVWRSRARPPLRETSRHLTRDPSIFDMQIGDIAQYEGRDWVVEGKLLYREDGFTWLEYMLQDQNDIRWLSVEEDDLVTVALLAPVTSLDVSLDPPQELTFEGQTYRCIESGVAQMRRQGNPRRPDVEQCRYFDYRGPGDRVLSIEDWDGDVEVTAGEVIPPRSLIILPGQGDSVYGVG